jgi:hypothetical protein
VVASGHPLGFRGSAVHGISGRELHAARLPRVSFRCAAYALNGGGCMRGYVSVRTQHLAGITANAPLIFDGSDGRGLVCHLGLAVAAMLVTCTQVSAQPALPDIRKEPFMLGLTHIADAGSVTR